MVIVETTQCKISPYRRNSDRVGTCNDIPTRSNGANNRKRKDRSFEVEGQFDDQVEGQFDDASTMEEEFHQSITPSLIPVPDGVPSASIHRNGLDATFDGSRSSNFPALTHPAMYSSGFALPSLRPLFPPLPLPLLENQPFHRLSSLPAAAAPFSPLTTQGPQALPDGLVRYPKRSPAKIPPGMPPPYTIMRPQARSIKRAYYQNMKAASMATKKESRQETQPVRHSDSNEECAVAPNPSGNPSANGNMRSPPLLPEQANPSTHQGINPQATGSARPNPVIIPSLLLKLPLQGGADPLYNHRRLPVVCDIDVPYVEEDTEKKRGVSDNKLTPSDVLCGRGGHTNNHMGNIFWRTLADHYRPDYVCARKQNKSTVAHGIVAAIRNTHGRFLKRDEELEMWFEIGDDKAKEKTSQMLREGIAPFRKKRNAKK